MNKFQYIVTTDFKWSAFNRDNSRLSEIRRWLTDNVGKPYDDWVTALGDRGYLEVRFVRESDATWFALKWL